MALKISERILQEIERQGYTEVRLWQNRGYNSHAHLDVSRWGANAKLPGGLNASLYSWYTMTQCIKAGFTIEKDDLGLYEISPKEPEKQVNKTL